MRRTNSEGQCPRGPHAPPARNSHGHVNPTAERVGKTARYDDLFTGRDEQIDVSKAAVSMDGIELQDREFVDALREGREPNSSIASVLGCYEVLGNLQLQLNQ